ncbi:MAG: two-component system response regulator [Sulfuritalea sp.]|nr:two-component system response regulator [Sulfuritalea sp.]
MPNDVQPTILVVDDTAENLHVLSGLLQPDYRVLAATSGERCLELAARSQPAPDLILLDIMMPGLDGYQTLERLRANAATREIPVIFITAMEGSEAQLHGLAAGAVDYIAKPIDPPIVLARVRTQIELKRARDRLKDQNAWLEAEVARRMAENETIQTVTIHALAHLAETRDPETGNHIHRTQHYVRALALRVRHHPRFKDFLLDRNIALVVRSAPLHDIGKVGIPDQILLKPGPLSPAEWVIMKTHAKLGSDAIELAEEDAAQPLDFLTLAKEIAHWHHEKWDGSGYPDGLAGEAIPWAARLMALADVFDALITRRPYKPALSFAQAHEIIVAGRGSHFDPDLTDAFIDVFDECVAIALQYRDTSEP